MEKMEIPNAILKVGRTLGWFLKGWFVSEKGYTNIASAIWRFVQQEVQGLREGELEGWRGRYWEGANARTGKNRQSMV